MQIMIYKAINKRPHTELLDTVFYLLGIFYGHIDVLLPMFMVKKNFLPILMYVITITMLIVKLVLTSYMCLLVYYHKYVVTAVSYNFLN